MAPQGLVWLRKRVGRSTGATAAQTIRTASSLHAHALASDGFDSGCPSGTKRCSHQRTRMSHGQRRPVVKDDPRELSRLRPTRKRAAGEATVSAATINLSKPGILCRRPRFIGGAGTRCFFHTRQGRIRARRSGRQSNVRSHHGPIGRSTFVQKAFARCVADTPIN